MKLKFKLALIAIAVHLVLVVIGGFKMHAMTRTGLAAIDRPLALYNSLSGSNSSYGFFAPDVAGEVRCLFTMTDATGNQWTDKPNSRGSAEATLRFDSTLGFFVDPEEKHIRKEVAASWAATMFGRHPEATQVKMFVEVQLAPTMPGYREGLRNIWQPVYEGTFSRQQDAT